MHVICNPTCLYRNQMLRSGEIHEVIECIRSCLSTLPRPAPHFPAQLHTSPLSSLIHWIDAHHHLSSVSSHLYIHTFSHTPTQVYLAIYCIYSSSDGFVSVRRVLMNYNNSLLTSSVRQNNSLLTCFVRNNNAEVGTCFIG